MFPKEPGCIRKKPNVSERNRMFPKKSEYFRKKPKLSIISVSTWALSSDRSLHEEWMSVDVSKMSAVIKRDVQGKM